MPHSNLPDWFSRAVAALRAADIDGWLSIYAPDAVHEFPWAPEGAVQRLEGREAIAAYMAQLPSRLRFGELRDLRVREAPGELIVEAVGHHVRVADGSPRVLAYVWFIEHERGKVTRFRDYMNPLQISRR